MNKKGQGIFFGIMVFIFTFAVAAAVAPALLEIIEDVVDPTNLDCDADNLSTGIIATCIIIDLVLPYFIAAVIASGTAYMYIRNR